jgi:hypothetical protein
MSDPLGPARGVLVGVLIGIAAWAVLLAVLGLLR